MVGPITDIGYYYKMSSMYKVFGSHAYPPALTICKAKENCFKKLE